MSEFNFKSQICTDKNQSERLLALGLKKETADCVWIEMSKDDWRVDANGWKEYYSIVQEGIFPAWSLHRLICMLPEEIVTDGYSYNLCIDNDSICHFEYSACTYEHFVRCENLYDAIVGYIEWLIKEGYFNKEYLEE